MFLKEQVLINFSTVPKDGFLKFLLRNKLGVFIILLVFLHPRLYAQIDIQAEAFFSPGSRTLSVKQEISYFNESHDALHEIYLNDWNHAFSSKTSPLGKHYSSHYLHRSHFSNQSERGETRIDVIKDKDHHLQWERLENQLDIIKVNLEKPLLPGETLNIQLQYTLRIPEEWITGFGVHAEGDFHLNNWLIMPAVYDKYWHLYSHQNLDDQYLPLSNLKILMKIPPEYKIYTDMNQQEIHSAYIYKV